MGMGAILGDLVRGVGEKIAPAITEHLGSGLKEADLNDIFGAKDAYFKIGGEIGEKIRQLHMDYQQARAANQVALDKPVNEAAQQVLAHSELRNKAGLHAPLIDVYKEASRLNHPLAQPGNALDQLIVRHPENEFRSLSQLKNQNIQHARVLASAQVFGPKMENVIPYVMPLLESKDPVQEHWAKGIMNLISNETKDTTTVLHEGSTLPASSSKLAIGAEIARRRRAEQLKGIASGLVTKGADGKYDYTPIADKFLKPFKAESTYKPPTIWERRIGNILRTVQLPAVALKHISTVGNLASIPAPRLVEGMLKMSDPEFKAFLDSTHILAYTDHDFMDRAMRGGSGMVARLTGSPTAGQIFFKSYHMPFFDFVRSKQLSYAASVGWAATTNWAKQALRDVPIAVANLKEMGLDVDQIKAQKGELTEDQLRKAIFHFVNNRFFMDKSVEQALASNSSMLMRSATMYHTFVNAQFRFFRRELTKMVKARDFVGLSQFAGMIGILWPAVAPMVKSVEIYGRTLNLKRAQQSEQQDYASLTSGDPEKMLGTYLNLLSYYAAFGVYTSYVQAARGDRLAYSMMGPSLGVAARTSSDLLNMAFRTDYTGKHDAAPVVRDALEDTLPIAGNILAHKIAPTTAERKLASGRLSRQRRRRRISPEVERWKF